MAGLDLDLNARSRWTEAMRPLFASFQSDLGLARRLALPNQKSEAGYLGQLRRGEQRGLVHFLHNDERLRCLEEALGNPGLKAILKRCLVADAVDRLYYAPGFEDLGPLPWNRYVPPPLLLGSFRRVSPNDGPQGLVAALNKGLLLSDNRDLWAATKAWAVADGWRLHEWEPGGRLPDGRAELLVLKGLRGPTELNEWCKAEGHGVLAMGIPAQHSLTTCQPQSANPDWLTAFLESLYDVVEPRLLRRLRRLKEADLEELVQAHPEPTSKELGIRLRALAEEGGTTLGSRLLISAAERRLEEPGALAGVDELLPGILLASWEPNTDLIGLFQREVVAQAQAVIDDLKGTQRRILERALPYLDGQAVWTSLKAADLVRTEPPSIENEVVGLLAKEAAVLVLKGPKAMKRCLLSKQHQVLHWVVRLPTGPEQVAKALQSMEPAAFHVAVEEAPEWLTDLEWTDTLVAKFISVLLGRPTKWRPSQSGSGIEMLHPLVGTQIAKAPLPSHKTIRKAWAWYNKGLNRDVQELGDDLVGLHRALLIPNAEDLARASVWSRAIKASLDLTSWSTWLLSSPANAETVIDLARPVGRTLAYYTAGWKDRRGMFLPKEGLLNSLWSRSLQSSFSKNASNAGNALAGGIRYLALRYNSEDSEDEIQSSFHKNPTDLLLKAIQMGASEFQGRNRRSAMEPIRSALLELLDTQLSPKAAEWWGVDGTHLLEKSRQEALGSLLETVLNGTDCKDRLVQSNGEIHPFWEALSRGCHPRDLADLHQRLQAGEIVAVPGKGFPSDEARTKESLMVRAQDEPIGPLLPSPEDLVYGAIFRHITPDTAIELLGSDSKRPIPLSRIKRDCYTLGKRILAWSFHQDLSEEDIIWSVFGGWTALHLTKEWADLKGRQPTPVPPGLDSQAFLALDRPYVLRLAELLPIEAAPEKWTTVVGQALRVGLGPDAHFDLLERVAGRFPTLTGVLLLRALDLDSRRARTWLEERLQMDLASIDHTDMRVPLLKADLPIAVLEAALQAQTTPCGDTLLPILQAKRPDLHPWLALDHTRAAATKLLVSSGLEAPGVLKSLESLSEAPSKSVLKALLEERGPQDLALLDEASSTWPKAQRRVLWLRVAEVASTAVASEALSRVAWLT